MNFELQNTNLCLGRVLEDRTTRVEIENKRLQDMLTSSWRPRHKDVDWSKSKEEENRHRDDFLMDFENSCLAYFGDNFPTGPQCHTNKEWTTSFKRQVYPHHSDVDWSEYVAWVSHGGGDERFTPFEEGR